MDPLPGDKRDAILNGRGSMAWAGALVGTLVGLLAGAVAMAIEVVSSSSGPQPDAYPLPTVWGPIGAISAIIAGTIAGAIGLKIGENLNSKGGAAISGTVGGATGGVIGGIAFMVGVIGLEPLRGTPLLGNGGYNAIELLLTTAFVCTLVGGIVGSISGLVVAVFGMKIGSLTPLFVLVGGCTSSIAFGPTTSQQTFMLGSVISVVIFWVGGVIIARGGGVIATKISHAARLGAFGAAIGGVVGAIYGFMTAISIWSY